jgi:hypothetical protein
VAYAISFYSMQAHLVANLLFVWLLLKPTFTRAFLAGVVGSVALLLHNPFPHTMFALPWILGLARTRGQDRMVLPLLAGYVPLLLVIGGGWAHMRQVISAGPSSFAAMSNDISWAFKLPDKAMLDAQVASFTKLWIWAVPGLFPLAVLGRMRLGSDLRVRLLVQSALLTCAGYVFFKFDQGHGWGYRYFHSAFGVVPILAGCGMAVRTQGDDHLTAFAGAAALLSLLVVLPVQLAQIQSVIAGHQAQLPPVHRPGNNVYFIRYSGLGFYLPDLVQMDPLLRDPDLILYSRGSDADARLLRENWPTATLVERQKTVQEWHLGEQDQRQMSADLPGVKHFIFSDPSGFPVPVPELK